MEESKELQNIYVIFRIAVYTSVLIEFFEYAFDPVTVDAWNGILYTIHERIGRLMIYRPGNLAYSKIATLLILIITCIGTKNKKNIEFDARKMVFWPITVGLLLIILSVILYFVHIPPRIFLFSLNTWIYMIMTVVGTVLVHVALDNISKYLKEGMLKDRFNFENESFEQCEEEQNNKYSVNIPMRYYYKGKFRMGWVNIVNPFRGTWVVGTPGSGKTFGGL